MQNVLARGDLILRKDLEEFERAFAEYVGTKYAVGVASGTDALLLSLKALGIGPGDKVLAPSYTFRATVEAIHHVGAEPVLYDMDGKAPPGKYAAVIPAHIAGELLYPTFPKGEYFLIEDAAQAIGAGPVMGNAACYSFYPAKILGCFGDGGAIATNDEALYKKLKMMRNHFKGDWRPYGYNSRLDNLQAAVLNVRLKELPSAIGARKQIARRYDAALNGLVGLPSAREVYQDYIIECKNEKERDALYDFLLEQEVETLKNGYPFPDALTKGPLTLVYEARSLRLPCNPDLEEDQVAYVIQCVQEYYKNNA